MRTKGRIARWNDAKGYGFIAPLDGGRQIFVHIRAFADRDTRPATGERVSYTVSRDRRGRPCATQARLASSRVSRAKSLTARSLQPAMAAAFLGVVALAVAVAALPPGILVLYLIASVITYVVYALDKLAARRGVSRTPENTLHAMSLAGGWPGAMFARQTLRHKTLQQPFRTLFWVTVVLNLAGFAWLFTPAARPLLDHLI